MVEYEADDALAAAAVKAAADSRVERVLICTPDKDLAQCVSGSRVVQLNRRTNVVLDEAGVTANSASCPGRFPITSRSSAMPPTATRVCRLGGEVLRCGLFRYGHLESIPRRLAHLGSQRRESIQPVGNAGARSGARVPVPRSRDAPVPTSPSSETSTNCAGPARRRPFRRSRRGWIVRVRERRATETAEAGGVEGGRGEGGGSPRPQRKASAVRTPRLPRGSSTEGVRLLRHVDEHVVCPCERPGRTGVQAWCVSVQVLAPGQQRRVPRSARRAGHDMVFPAVTVAGAETDMLPAASSGTIQWRGSWRRGSVWTGMTPVVPAVGLIRLSLVRRQAAGRADEQQSAPDCR